MRNRNYAISKKRMDLHAGYELYEDYTTGDQTHTLSLIDEGNRFVMIENSSQYGLLTRYQHPNHQSSACVETNEKGDVITYEEYHPFGTTAYQATNATIKAATKRYRYTGMERDEETGLSYHNARYYITWLGRWINPDPIGIGDGVNVYAYCENNPVNFLDPSGFNGVKADKEVNIYPSDPYALTPTNGDPEKITIASGDFAENDHKNSQSLPKVAENGQIIRFEYNTGPTAHIKLLNINLTLRVLNGNQLPIGMMVALHLQETMLTKDSPPRCLHQKLKFLRSC